MTALHATVPSADAPLPVACAIERPHPDIELGVERRRLDYIVAFPQAGITSETGLVVFLVGYGMHPFAPYVQRLLAWLADRHNCVAVSPHYFGAVLSDARTSMAPDARFFEKIEQHYGLKVAASKGLPIMLVVKELAEVLAANGIAEFPRDCVILGDGPEYQSMGFLPALDTLQVIHRLILEHGLDKRRLFLLGTSYGGYIAGMTAKLAPQTFRMVVDNSGFSSSDDDVRGRIGMPRLLLAGKVWAEMRLVKSFSPDPKAPNYFSHARAAIRSLLNRAHVYDNTARIYAWHSVADTVAPTERKIGLRKTYAGKAPYDLTLVDESRIDGRIFKTLEHGMKASMRGCFELACDKFLADGGARGDHTDFDRESRYVFACGAEDYVMHFSARDGVTAALRPAA